MSKKDKCIDDADSAKQCTASMSTENHSVNRRDLLKAMGKLTYIAPTLSIISLSSNALADIPSIPHPSTIDPNDPNDPNNPYSRG